MYKVKTTRIPYKKWPLRERAIERMYRWTHNGQIRTLVMTERNVFRMVTVKQLKEMLDDFNDDLPITNVDGDYMIGTEETEFTDESGPQACVQIEFENDGQ